MLDVEVNLEAAEIALSFQEVLLDRTFLLWRILAHSQHHPVLSLYCSSTILWKQRGLCIQLWLASSPPALQQLLDVKYYLSMWLVAEGRIICYSFTSLMSPQAGLQASDGSPTSFGEDWWWFGFSCLMLISCRTQLLFFLFLLSAPLPNKTK